MSTSAGRKKIPLRKTHVLNLVIGSHNFFSSFILLDIKDFDLILGYKLLTFYHALLNSFCMGVMFRLHGKRGFFFPCQRGGTKGVLVSSHKARSLPREGCACYLISISDNQKESKLLSEINVVCEYPDVFLEDLLGLPPDRAMEFSIDLAPGTASISKAPYHMALTELVELKKQLEELLNQGFL